MWFPTRNAGSCGLGWWELAALAKATHIILLIGVALATNRHLSTGSLIPSGIALQVLRSTLPAGPLFLVSVGTLTRTTDTSQVVGRARHRRVSTPRIG